jgi:hypothetical protein
MRNIFKTTLLATLLATTAAAAQAESYFEGGFIQVSADEGDISVSHYGALGVIGAVLQSTEQFSHNAEAIIVAGLNSDKVYGIDVKLQSMVGLAYRPTIQLSDSIALSGRAGIFRARVKASGFGESASDTSSDFGIGIGIDFKKVSLSYLNVDDTNFVMATYRF